MKVKFSIIVPVQEKYKPLRLPKGVEVIYVSKFTKSKARNWGAMKASGNYLIHIDCDNTLTARKLFEAKIQIEKHGYEAVILEEYINGNSIWQKARNLERKVNLGNTPLSTPQIIETKLFRKIGGYDERFNELDDWGLYMRLSPIAYSSSTIPQATCVYEPTNVFEILKRLFKKGRELNHFKQIYPNASQLNIQNLLTSYAKSEKLIAKSWVVGFSLLILKLFDWLGLWLGSLFPIYQDIDQVYKDTQVAKNFDLNQKGLISKIKHHLEILAIHKSLTTNHSVLDLGCGTGRITRELVKHHHKVTPCDISAAMLSEYKKDKTLPKPVLLKSDILPFENSSFDTVFSLRVIWHIKDKKKREKFFAEATRVAKKNVIMDFSLINSPSDHKFSLLEIRSIAKKHNLKILNWYYLPFFRLLINFQKNYQ